jgi:hypothetical protein
VSSGTSRKGEGKGRYSCGNRHAFPLSLLIIRNATSPFTMSSESEGSPEPYQNVSVTRSEESFEEDGDLEILSSDGILFRIHAYRFQASS